MLAPLVLDVLSPLWGMLSAELGPLPFLAIGCLLGAPLLQAQVGGLRLTPPTAVDRPRSHDNADRQFAEAGPAQLACVCDGVSGRLAAPSAIYPLSAPVACCDQPGC